jgi:D-inositol-3-phosphate glycosyltransferase
LTENKQKIAFFCTSKSLGGLELNIIRLAIWLEEYGHEVYLFIRENSPMHKLSVKKSLKYAFVFDFWKYYDFPKAAKFARQLKKNNFNYIFSFQSADVNFVSLAKSFASSSIKHIFQQQMHIGLDKKDIFHTMSFNQIDYWIAPLENLAEEVKKHTRYDLSKVRIIPLGIETNTFANSTISKSQARAYLDLNESDFILGILGRIDRQKGQLFVLECLKQMLDNSQNIHLCLMGDTTIGQWDGYYKEVMDFVKNNNLENHVHLNKFDENTQYFYNAIDVFCLVSISETYGMVTIEAMSSALPIIATNSGGSPEILSNGEFGYLYNFGNHQEFINHVNFIRDNPNESKIKAKKAQEKAISSYSHKLECELIEGIFRNDLKQKKLEE